MYSCEVEGKENISVKVVADSICPEGVRITTLELNYPRFIHSEFMTHRMFSRNASSSRAIPTYKLLDQVRSEPARPIHWGINRPGMQAFDELEDISAPRHAWGLAAKSAVEQAEDLLAFNLHKQLVNRVLEPFQFIKVVVTATEWDNFFALREHKDAQPEIQELARLMHKCLRINNPILLQANQWHLPYILEADLDAAISSNDLLAISAARCARVSYLNHDKETPDIAKDMELFKMLSVRPYDDGKGHILAENDPVHLSPLEHQATPMSIKEGPGITHKDVLGNYWSGNFRGWIQHRQII